MTIIMNKETHWVVMSGIKRKISLKYRIMKKIYSTNKGIYFMPRILKIYSKIRIQKYSDTASICYVNNRCLLSGRGYSIKSKYKLSRFFLRKNYNRLLISGLKRASW